MVKFFDRFFAPAPVQNRDDTSENSDAASGVDEINTPMHKSRWLEGWDFCAALLCYQMQKGYTYGLMRTKFHLEKTGSDLAAAGGSAFLLQIAICALVYIVPISVDAGLGQFAGKSAMGVYCRLVPLFTGVGWAKLVALFLLLLSWQDDLIVDIHKMGQKLWSRDYASCQNYDRVKVTKDNSWCFSPLDTLLNGDMCLIIFNKTCYMNREDTMQIPNSATDVLNLTGYPVKVSSFIEAYLEGDLNVISPVILADKHDDYTHTMIMFTVMWLVLLVLVLTINIRQLGQLSLVLSMLPFCFVAFGILPVVLHIIPDSFVAGMKEIFDFHPETLISASVGGGWFEAFVMARMIVGPNVGVFESFSAYNNFHNNVHAQILLVLLINLMSMIIFSCIGTTMLARRAMNVGKILRNNTLDIGENMRVRKLLTDDYVGTTALLNEALSGLQLRDDVASEDLLFSFEMLQLTLQFSTLAVLVCFVAGVLDALPQSWLESKKNFRIIQAATVICLYSLSWPLAIYRDKTGSTWLDIIMSVITNIQGYSLLYLSAALVVYIYGMDNILRDAKLMQPIPMKRRGNLSKWRNIGRKVFNALFSINFVAVALFNLGVVTEVDWRTLLKPHSSWKPAKHLEARIKQHATIGFKLGSGAILRHGSSARSDPGCEVNVFYSSLKDYILETILDVNYA